MRNKPRGYKTPRRTRTRLKRPKPVKSLPSIEQQQLKKKIKEVNRRISLIEKKFGTDKWAVKKLKTKLSIPEIRGLDRKGRVKRVSGKDAMKIKAVNKALDLFLKAKTSTVAGIRDTINRSKKTIKELLVDDTDINIEEIDENIDNLDDEDVETFYDFYEEEDFKWLINYIDPSELMVIIQVARSENWTENRWLNELNNYIEYGNDKDIIRRLKRLYNNLVNV